MSKIRIREAGLVAFAVKLGSAITGLAFVVIVTSTLPQQSFGLWGLIGRVIGYSYFPVVIISFWTTRFSARGESVGKTVLIASLIFSAVLVPVYLLISYLTAGLVSEAAPPHPNLFYYLISTPQVLLYILAATLEGILWGTNPVKGSWGLALFEVAKVPIGFVAVRVLRLSLEGAILAVIGAQIVQIVSLFVFTRKDITLGIISFAVIKRIVRTGWLAILNNLHPLVISLDFQVVAIFTLSTLPIAYYSAALAVATAVSYSGFLASGLYPSILAGKDAGKASTQVMELQVAFLVPMTIGATLLSRQLLHLLKPPSGDYSIAAPILWILIIATAFSSLQATLDSIILGSETIDSNTNSAIGFSSYVRSKLFLLSRINLSISAAYLITLAIAVRILTLDNLVTTGSIFGLSSYIFLGVCWAIASTGAAVAGFFLKLSYARKIARISLGKEISIAILIASIIFTISLYFLSLIIVPVGGKVEQAAILLFLGIVSISIYGGVLLALSQTVRNLARMALTNYLGI